MSQMGQSQSFGHVTGMSALHPTSDHTADMAASPTRAKAPLNGIS